MAGPAAPTERTTLKRLPDRGRFDEATVGAILDGSPICHLGFVADGHPVVIPTICARAGSTVYVHGSVASRMLRTLKAGAEVCLTVTLVDGLVIGRSAFHHSMNYRSVVLFGTARLVTDDAEKLAALEAITNHVVPGRWAEARHPDQRELRLTHVLALPISEASAKVRSGPPVDEPGDYELPIWAGEVPLRTVTGPLVPDTQLAAGVEVPPSVQALLASG